MFLLQNGLNTVTGDPLLDVERAWQIDVGLRYDQGPLAFEIHGFHSWVLDYITFENLGVGRPFGTPEQVQLKFVNTELATLVGAEFNLSMKLGRTSTTYAAVSYISGRDHTRNGNFATRRASLLFRPSVQVPGLPRGYFSDVPGAAEEPLPGVLPLDSRLRLCGCTRGIAATLDGGPCGAGCR